MGPPTQHAQEFEKLSRAPSAIPQDPAPGGWEPSVDPRAGISIFRVGPFVSKVACVSVGFSAPQPPREPPRPQRLRVLWRMQGQRSIVTAALYQHDRQATGNTATITGTVNMGRDERSAWRTLPQHFSRRRAGFNERDHNCGRRALPTSNYTGTITDIVWALTR